MFPFVLGVTQLCISMNKALSLGASTQTVDAASLMML